MHLFLIGPRGSGKSTVAPLLAGRLRRPWWGIDAEIQADTGMTIAEIFRLEGEQRFRALESAALAQAVRRPPGVFDLGGGAILASDNRDLMRECGHAVWLFASPQALWNRIASDPATPHTRPALLPTIASSESADDHGDSDAAGETSDPAGLVEMRRIVRDRAPLYAACADYEIDTGRLEPDEIARRIAVWFATVDKSKSRTQ